MIITGALIRYRARKVKCDETKPVCNRCKTTGRTCDGYGIWGGGGNNYADRYCPTSKQEQLCVSPESYPAGNISCDEGDCMQWLHSEILCGTSSFFDATFWTDLVVPAAWSVPAVTHAVVALAAALRGVNSTRQGLPDVQQQLTLRQYTKAIRLLQPLLLNQDNMSITLVLVTCLLFTCLEYLREQYRAAALHLHNGLKLLKDIHSDSADRVYGVIFIRPALYKRAIHRAIFRGFATLHVQANLFGNHLPDVALLVQTTDDEMPSPTFASLEEARDSLDKLLHGMIILNHRVKAAFSVSEALSLSFIEAREIGLCRLRTWQETYDTTVKRLPHGQTRTRQAYKLLLNYYALAKIMCTCMFSASELIFSEHTHEFLSIVRRSVVLWNRHVVSQGTASSCRPTIDMGWIPPLYYTAIKCRIPRIRRHAIKMLRAVPQKEGVWDSTLAANVAEKVMLLEESYTSAEVCAEPDFACHDVPNLKDLEDCALLPEANLFHEVLIELSETSNITLTCRKRQRLHSCHESRWRFDGEEWHDLNCTTKPPQHRPAGPTNIISPPQI